MEHTDRPTALAARAQQSAREGAKIATLTAGERQVIMLVGEGLRNEEIARRLSLSESTVHQHLRAISAKLGVGGRLELLVYAYESINRSGEGKTPELEKPRDNGCQIAAISAAPPDC